MNRTTEHPADARIQIDGCDVTNECERFDIATPRLVYQEDDGRSVRRFVGPQGFQVTLINPSERLRALVDGGLTTHIVKVTASGMTITHPTHFHEEWDAAGTRKVFGSLAIDHSNDPKWVKEGA